MLKQQILGIINLSFPLIIIYTAFPALLALATGKLIGALLVGAWIWYLSWKQLNALTQSLQYSPTGEHKELYETLIRDCQVDPATVTIRYAYTSETLAMAAQSTIIIDPVVWNIQDPEAAKVMDIFEQHIKPTLTEPQKARIAATREALTPAAERFIFKHELGHIVRNISQRKLFSLFVVGASAAYTALLAASAVMHISGFLAVAVGMLVGFVADLAYAMIVNAVWRLQEEKAADRFAAQYSSAEEIEAAAEFFAQHQEILDHNPEPNNLFAMFPSELRTGHPNGKTRAADLMNAK